MTEADILLKSLETDPAPGDNADPGLSCHSTIIVREVLMCTCCQITRETNLT